MGYLSAMAEKTEKDELRAEIERLRQEGRWMLDCIVKRDAPDLGDLNRWIDLFAPEKQTSVSSDAAQAGTDTPTTVEANRE